METSTQLPRYWTFVENISISPGATITVGSSGAESTIDVSSILPAAAASHRNYRKVHVIGAAKDMTVSGDVTFTNTNDVEDHALVLAAADDLMPQVPISLTPDLI